jgi:thioesterase domain-containing protein
LPSILANIPRKLTDDLFRSPQSLARRLRVKLRAWSSPLRLVHRFPGSALPSLGEEFLDTRNLPELYKQRLEVSVRALRGYRPGTYRGQLAVLKCNIRPIIHVAEPDLGWKHWVDGVVEVKLISGHHGNLFKEPQIRIVARMIAELVGPL